MPAEAQERGNSEQNERDHQPIISLHQASIDQWLDQKTNEPPATAAVVRKQNGRFLAWSPQCHNSPSILQELILCYCEKTYLGTGPHRICHHHWYANSDYNNIVTVRFSNGLKTKVCLHCLEVNYARLKHQLVAFDLFDDTYKRHIGAMSKLRFASKKFKHMARVLQKMIG
jgi:hypothetical protein